MAKKRISVKSAKAKGRKLQDLVAEGIQTTFSLDKRDAHGAIMGDTGMDIKLSTEARRLFPYAVECKANKVFSLYKYWEQAEANKEDLSPLLVIKGDRKKALAIMDLDQFFKLLGDR